MHALLWSVCALIAAMAPQRAGAQPTEVVLHNFGSPPKGAYPRAGVIRDKAGNLYGTTVYGGPANRGVVYKVDPSGHETVLHAFTTAGDGAHPYGRVVRDSAGNLYGTTYQGGAVRHGIVYKIDTTGQETILYSFTGGDDGANPEAGVILDSAGNLYGTTRGGGPGRAGVVFKLDPTGYETVLYSFTGKDDGGGPEAGVVRDPAGNLYGTTRAGGTSGCGVVYKVDAAGHQTVLYKFAGPDGCQPSAGVVLDSAGNLYGTTPTNVYKLDAAGHETILHTFTGGADGGDAIAGVTRDAAGNLYGAADLGGAGGAGVVYKVDSSGNETVLYSFTGGADGNGPQGTVILDAAGNV